MRLLPDRWTIDFWPMRLIASIYLTATGALLAGAIILAGSAKHAALALVGGAAVAVFFVLATALIWTPVRGHWIAAAVAALIGGGAWWMLAYAALNQPRRAAPGAAIVLIAMTAIVTLGVLAATLQRAPADT